jgi:acyl carrier protein
MKKETLEQEIKEIIISALDLEDITVADIDSKAPLFNEGLGLDSIDALELGMALKKKYDVNFKSDKDENKEYFKSVESLVKYIAESKNITLE